MSTFLDELSIIRTDRTNDEGGSNTVKNLLFGYFQQK
jgi:hypothetical protein